MMIARYKCYQVYMLTYPDSRKLVHQGTPNRGDALGGRFGYHVSRPADYADTVNPSQRAKVLANGDCVDVLPQPAYNHYERPMSRCVGHFI